MRLNPLANDALGIVQGLTRANVPGLVSGAEPQDKPVRSENLFVLILDGFPLRRVVGTNSGASANGFYTFF